LTDKKDSLRYRYKDGIERFFKGEQVTAYDSVRGKVWVARHDGFDTLTVEPSTGGQYEIAVRITNMPSYGQKTGYTDVKYVEDIKGHRGYVAGPGYLIGVNTDGH
jgi:hypothetical protein